MNTDIRTLAESLRESLREFVDDLHDEQLSDVYLSGARLYLDTGDKNFKLSPGRPNEGARHRDTENDAPWGAWIWTSVEVGAHPGHDDEGFDAENGDVTEWVRQSLLSQVGMLVAELMHAWGQCEQVTLMMAAEAYEILLERLEEGANDASDDDEEDMKHIAGFLVKAVTKRDELTSDMPDVWVDGLDDDEVIHQMLTLFHALTWISANPHAHVENGLDRLLEACEKKASQAQ